MCIYLNACVATSDPQSLLIYRGVLAAVDVISDSLLAGVRTMTSFLYLLRIKTLLPIRFPINHETWLLPSLTLILTADLLLCRLRSLLFGVASESVGSPGKMIV